MDGYGIIHLDEYKRSKNICLNQPAIPRPDFSGSYIIHYFDLSPFHALGD